MNVTHERDDEQARLWNSLAGCAWVDEQELIDQVLKPFEELLVETVPAVSGGLVLDVGCGTGGTTLAIAQRLGARGSSVGIDISEPMIAAARARVQREGTSASFVCANAQTHAFEPASFDMIVSRFGVMFFEDPVQAFANLRRAARDNAALRFIAWRDATENPFMTTAERAAAPLLPEMPARRPSGPGQFAFGDRRRVESILNESGWGEIDIRPVDVECRIPEKALIRYFTRFGPVGLILQEVDEPTRARVIGTVRLAFDPYVRGDDIVFSGACWMVSARAR